MPGCVLIVDDDQSIRELISMTLEDEGYTVVTAPEGKSALEKVAEQSPDVILLDTRMPVMDGWEFARQFRELPASKASLIMLTAVDDPDNAASELGADAYLAKPFDLNDLSEIVARFMQACGR